MSETPSGFAPDQAASRNVDNPLTIYQRMKENALKGRDMDVGGFLTDLEGLDSTGVIDKLPALRDQILKVGHDPLLWLEVYRRTRDGVNVQDHEQIQRNLRLAHLLGMDQQSNDPRSQAAVDQINQWKTQWGETEGIQNPARRRLLINMLKLGGIFLAGAAVDRLIAFSSEPGPKPPEQPVNLFNEVVRPFIDEAMKKRAERARTDPEFYHRIDQELNYNRINLLLFGYSEEHGESYEEYGGVPTILSYNLTTGQIGVVHLSRDIRVPELERLDPKGSIDSQRVRSIFKKGGFDQMRTISEDITGLAIDYQIVLKDAVVRDAIRDLADGSLNLDIPKDHHTGPFRFDGKLEDPNGSFIQKGPQQMTTEQLMRYILAEDKQPGGKEDERSYRKNQVMTELSKKIKAKTRANPLFLLTLINFIKQKESTKELRVDFDLSLLNRGAQLMGGLVNAVGQLIKGREIAETNLPEMDPNKQLVFHDAYFGDGGVTRVHNIKNVRDPLRVDHPKVLDDIRNDLLPPWMLIPNGGNPYAKDLVNEYWQSVRKMVKEKLQS